MLARKPLMSMHCNVISWIWKDMMLRFVYVSEGKGREVRVNVRSSQPCFAVVFLRQGLSLASTWSTWIYLGVGGGLEIELRSSCLCGKHFPDWDNLSSWTWLVISKGSTNQTKYALDFVLALVLQSLVKPEKSYEHTHIHTKIHTETQKHTYMHTNSHKSKTHTCVHTYTHIHQISIPSLSLGHSLRVY